MFGELLRGKRPVKMTCMHKTPLDSLLHSDFLACVDAISKQYFAVSAVADLLHHFIAIHRGGCVLMRI